MSSSISARQYDAPTRSPDREAPRAPLGSFASNIHSQWGEDGILAEIMSRLGLTGADPSAWCVEFGAWDGMHLSNSANLILNHGFRGVMIEGAPRRYDDLCRNHPGDEVVKLNRMVALDGENRLDAILAQTDLPHDFALLSIDIDGADYHVWDGLVDYHPKVVVIEYNPTVPVEVSYVQPADMSVRHGSGLKAMDDLAREKGYVTVCTIGSNLIAVRGDVLFDVLDETPPPIEEMGGADAARYFFVGYDGTVLSNTDHVPLNWHPSEARIEDMQVLPRMFRDHGETFGPLRWGAFGIFDAWRRFGRMIRHRN